MEVSPNIHTAAVIEKTSEGNRAFTGGIKGVRACTVSAAIKNSIEVTSKDCGDGRINIGSNIIKELVSLRVMVGSINTDDTKVDVM